MNLSSYGLTPDLDVDLRLANLSATQYGMFTLEQARRLDVTVEGISHRLDTGLLFEFEPGIYTHAAGPADMGIFAFLRAAWLALNPTAFTVERFETLDAVVTGKAACMVHDVGDMMPEPFMFAVGPDLGDAPAGTELINDLLTQSDFLSGPGFPVARVETALPHAAWQGEDISNLADTLREAWKVFGHLNVPKMVAGLDRVAKDYGFADGRSFFETLHREAVGAPAGAPMPAIGYEKSFPVWAWRDGDLWAAQASQTVIAHARSLDDIEGLIRTLISNETGYPLHTFALSLTVDFEGAPE
jgi:hypothetical protein